MVLDGVGSLGEEDLGAPVVEENRDQHTRMPVEVFPVEDVPDGSLVQERGELCDEPLLVFHSARCVSPPRGG